ncbi:MAG: hypothetical protein Q8O74_06000 [bacterium]|nr:hypothetical protein [bacterium]
MTTKNSICGFGRVGYNDDPEWLRPVQNYRMLIFGASMAGMMIFRPQGLLPSKRRKMELED